MVSLPFIYFLVLFINSVYKRGFDVYAYFLLIFIISSFFSILFVEHNLYANSSVPTYPIGVLAPLVYCITLTICLLPFKRFNSNRIKFLVNNIDEKLYNWVIYVYFGMFLLLVLVSITQIQNIVSSQNLAAMRGDFYKGDQENIWSRFSGWQRYMVAGISMIAGSCRLLIVFFFVNIIYLRKSFIFNVMTLLGSMASLILSLYIVDRSGFVFWFLIFGLAITLFRKQLRFKMIKPFLIFAIPLMIIILAYFIAVTVSRFGNQSGGNALDGVIVYAGQSFLNFCNYFNHLGFDAPFSLQPLFPLIHKLLGLPNYFDQCEIVEKYYGHGVSNFSTFLGCILSISGKFVLFLFVLVYYKMSNMILRRTNKQCISIKKLIHFFIVALIPTLGLFAYPYYNYSATFEILIWILLGYYLNIKSKVNVNLLYPKS